MSLPHAIEKKLTKYGIDAFFFYPPLLALFGLLLYREAPSFLVATGKMFILLSPVWLPIFLFLILWKVWTKYTRAMFLAAQDYSVLEIRIPREIHKSPAAMELFLTSLHSTSGETTFINRIFEGKTRPIWSLEICSFEGTVRFFIHTRKFFKNVVEARLYAQYPEIEVHEVEDYARKVVFNPETMNLYGTEYKFSKPDPYPIKTYIDFGLGDDPKEEFKNDPLSNTLEHLGSLGPGEYLWVQYIIRVHRNTEDFNGIHVGPDHFNDAAEEEVKKIKDEARTDVELTPDLKSRSILLTEGQKRRIEGIERKRAKLLFDVGIRTIYFARNEQFNPYHITLGVNSMFKNVSSNDVNAIGTTRGIGRFDYPWQDFADIRKSAERKRLHKYYRERAYFFFPYDQKPIVMNVEELATVYHFPGETAHTPTLARVFSRKGGAPVNLPT